MLEVGFNEMLPLSSANFSVDLAINFLNQVVFVTFVVKKIAVAGFASENSFSAWVKLATNLGIYQHRVAVRAKCPSSRGVT